MGRKLCWLLKQGPVTHRFCLGHLTSAQWHQELSLFAVG